MKLDASDLRYMSADEFRVLTAVEMGSKNHEVVPTTLIAHISGLRSGGVNKILGSLAQTNLVARVQNSKYDGYRLTYGGYDYLAIRALSKRDSMSSVGNQIGVGKESDIHIVADKEGNEMVLKLHRLGRISFRAIKQKRDYMGKRKSASWMYMSRLAAQKEWSFMKVLHEHGFPVPRPIDQARHCILMEFIDAFPLRQVSNVPAPGKLYSTLMDIIVRLAHAGLIHGDFNEFNILIRHDTGEPVVIDFPQMVSTSHENAEWYFNRDVECIRAFFRRKFQYESALYPRFHSTMADGTSEDASENFRLDVAVAASGFKNKDMKVLEEYMHSASSETPNMEDDGSDEEEELVSSEQGDDTSTESEAEQEEPLGGVPESSTSQCEAGQPAEQEEVNDANDAVSQTMDSAEEKTGRDRARSDGEISSASERSRQLSRSPPRSRSPSPETVEKMMAALSLTAALRRGMQDAVASDLSRQRARQHRKHHTRNSTHRAGRPRGGKGKLNPRVNLDSGMWD